MTGNLNDLAERYNSSFQGFLKGASETSLRQAYDLGRQALIEGLGVLEITVLYHQALGEALHRTLGPSDAGRVIQAGESFFLESLAPFEMTQRGFRETNGLLQASDQRYRELFDNASDIVFTADLNGNIVSINPSGAQIMGYRNGEMPSVNISE